MAFTTPKDGRRKKKIAVRATTGRHPTTSRRTPCRGCAGGSGQRSGSTNTSTSWRWMIAHVFPTSHHSGGSGAPCAAQAEFLVGKHSTTLECLRQYCADHPHDHRLEVLLVPEALPVHETIGLVFTTDRYRTKVPEILGQQTQNNHRIMQRGGGIMRSFNATFIVQKACFGGELVDYRRFLQDELRDQFQGIEKMRCVRVNADAAAQVSQLFARLPALTELEIYGNVEWVEHALRAAPLLRRVTVNLDWLQNSHTCLREIICSCSAVLTIRYFAKIDIHTLCAGLEGTTSLTDLTVDLRNGDYNTTDTASILESLQRNSSLVRFTLELPPRMWANCVLAESLLAYIRSPRRSRSLTFLSLHLGNTKVNASVSGEIVEMLLHCNATLQQIEGLTYASVDHERQIRRLLLLNRYGASLVANAATVPMVDWGDVLVRIGMEECNFFVTQLVKRAVERWGH